MTTDELEITGRVLPGPTMTPPYFSDVRCVIWAAGARGEFEASSSGALSFVVRLDDGVEMVVEPVGASAVLAVRAGIAFQREDGPDGCAQISALGVAGEIGRQEGSRITQRSRVVAWLAVGDEVTVEGRQFGGAPFRGRQSLAATEIRVAGGRLEVAVLEAGEAEPPADSSSGP
jgi:hypothetical protein